MLSIAKCWGSARLTGASLNQASYTGDMGLSGRQPSDLSHRWHVAQ